MAAPSLLLMTLLQTESVIERLSQLLGLSLSDVHGVLHVIPNGSITGVSNMTRGWSRAVLDTEWATRRMSIG